MDYKQEQKKPSPDVTLMTFETQYISIHAITTAAQYTHWK